MVDPVNDVACNKPIKILFVCSANLCRSPLAKIIAEKLYDGVIEAKSAGVSPTYCPVYEEAVCVAEKFYGADFSGHKPRHVLEYPLEEFDYIIAMDSSVHKALADMKPVPKDKIYVWEIADPCGYGIEAYERAAREIELELERFLLNRETETGTVRRSG
jgi:protein-tyrosine-phosphatase